MLSDHGRKVNRWGFFSNGKVFELFEYEAVPPWRPSPEDRLRLWLRLNDVSSQSSRWWSRRELNPLMGFGMDSRTQRFNAADRGPISHVPFCFSFPKCSFYDPKRKFRSPKWPQNSSSEPSEGRRAGNCARRPPSPHLVKEVAGESAKKGAESGKKEISPKRYAGYLPVYIGARKPG